MTTFFGKYASTSTPAISNIPAGVTIHLDATDQYVTGTTTSKVINTAGTYHIFKLPPYSRLIDVQMHTDAIAGAATCSAYAANVALLMYAQIDAAGTVDRQGSIFILPTAFVNASIPNILSLRGQSITLSATNNDLGLSGATYTASAVRSIFTGASEVFNVAATEKYLSYLVTASIGSGAQGLAATPAYTYWGVDYRMCDPIADVNSQ